MTQYVVNASLIPHLFETPNDETVVVVVLIEWIRRPVFAPLPPLFDPCAHTCIGHAPDTHITYPLGVPDKAKSAKPTTTH